MQGVDCRTKVKLSDEINKVEMRSYCVYKILILKRYPWQAGVKITEQDQRGEGY
jgi:hypothetical protein